MRKTKRFSRIGWTAAWACGLVAALSACGSADNPTASGPSGTRQSHRAIQPPKGAQQDMADMVAAVTTTKSGPPVELKFMLAEKPEVGQPLDIGIAIVPHAPGLESLSATFQAPDGLELVEGAQTGAIAKPPEGEPVKHSVKVLPQRDGIFAVTAVVSVAAGNDTSSRTYSIPVIAGQGLPGLAAKPDASKGL